MLSGQQDYAAVNLMMHHSPPDKCLLRQARAGVSSGLHWHSSLCRPGRATAEEQVDETWPRHEKSEGLASSCKCLISDYQLADVIG